MNEISICESCVSKRNIILCRGCFNYSPNNKGFQNFYENEDVKAENLQIKDDQFFSITEVNGNVIFLIRNQVDNTTIQIPLSIPQCSAIQRHLHRITKFSKEKSKQQLAPTENAIEPKGDS